MTERTLYLVCYDIADHRRLYRIHKHVKAYAIGGQKSFYECWLTAAELASLQDDLEIEMDVLTDRIHFFQLDPRIAPVYIGLAHRQSLKPFLIM